jgi:hypothetical protein
VTRFVSGIQNSYTRRPCKQKEERFFSLLKSEKESIRPCAIIAEGPTKNSIESLIDESMIQKVFNIAIFTNNEEALEHIKKELRTAKF